MNTQNIYYVDEKIPEDKKTSANSTFENYSNLWMTTSKYSLAEKTYRRYEDLLIRINAGIGHIKISKLSSYHINEFLNKLTEIGVNKRTGKGLSEKTVLHHYRLISVILQQATREKIIKSNPASRDFMRVPKVNKTKIKCLQIEEIDFILKEIKNESIKWQTATLILLFTGIRRGELLGLEWKDIDFKNKTLTIERTSQYSVQKGIYTKEPKTKSSIRTFRISDKVLNIFNNYLVWYKNNYCNNITERLFLNNNNSNMHPDSLTDWLKKFSSKYTLRTRITPHLLRHTYISLMVSKNISLKEIAERVGHSQISTTYNVYTHSLKVADIQASKALDDLI